MILDAQGVQENKSPNHKKKEKKKDNHVRIASWTNI